MVVQHESGETGLTFAPSGPSRIACSYLQDFDSLGRERIVSFDKGTTSKAHKRPARRICGSWTTPHGLLMSITDSPWDEVPGRGDRSRRVSACSS